MRQPPTYIKYPKPKSNRPYGSKPRFRPGVILEGFLIAFVLLGAWAGFIFFFGLVSK